MISMEKATGEAKMNNKYLSLFFRLYACETLSENFFCWFLLVSGGWKLIFSVSECSARFEDYFIEVFFEIVWTLLNCVACSGMKRMYVRIEGNLLVFCEFTCMAELKANGLKLKKNPRKILLWRVDRMLHVNIASIFFFSIHFKASDSC